MFFLLSLQSHAELCQVRSAWVTLGAVTVPLGHVIAGGLSSSLACGSVAGGRRGVFLEVLSEQGDAQLCHCSMDPCLKLLYWLPIKLGLAKPVPRCKGEWAPINPLPEPERTRPTPTPGAKPDAHADRHQPSPTPQP